MPNADMKVEQGGSKQSIIIKACALCPETIEIHAFLLQLF